MTELEYQREFVSKLLTRIDDLEFIIRDISLFVSAGGFNSDEVPTDATKRIKEGIIKLALSNKQ